MTAEAFEEHCKRGRVDYFAEQRRMPYPLNEPGLGWTEFAACRSADPATFFPETKRAGGRPTTPSAVMSFCDGCEVAPECLRHALLREEFGWWAGTAPAERVRLRRVLGIPFVYTTPRNRAASVPAAVPCTVVRALCGTDSGYYAHLRQFSETPCEACRAAHAESERRRVARQQRERVGAMA